MWTKLTDLKQHWGRLRATREQTVRDLKMLSENGKDSVEDESEVVLPVLRVW